MFWESAQPMSQQENAMVFFLEKELEITRAQGAKTETLRLPDFTILRCTACEICITELRLTKLMRGK